MSGGPARIERPKLLSVPTVQDLVFQGLATSLAVDKQGKTTMARISSEGNALLGEALLENGRRMRDHNAAVKVSRKTLATPGVPVPDPWPAWE